jgi:hypothetical protein
MISFRQVEAFLCTFFALCDFVIFVVDFVRLAATRQNGITTAQRNAHDLNVTHEDENGPHLFGRKMHDLFSKVVEDLLINGRIGIMHLGAEDVDMISQAPAR